MRSTSDSGQGRRRSGSTTTRGSSDVSGFSGIHHRRDKRFPMNEGQMTPADIQAAQELESNQQLLSEDTTDEAAAAWNEALMLWLSWNSTYEKVTAKMCKPGQDATKLERLMDEMDQLRTQAIKTTEQLLGAESAI